MREVGLTSRERKKEDERSSKWEKVQQSIIKSLLLVCVLIPESGVISVLLLLHSKDSFCVDGYSIDAVCNENNIKKVKIQDVSQGIIKCDAFGRFRM